MQDDLIIAAKTFNRHILALEEVTKAIDKTNLTLNPKNCSFRKNINCIFGNDFLITWCNTRPQKN